VPWRQPTASCAALQDLTPTPRGETRKPCRRTAQAHKSCRAYRRPFRRAFARDARQDAGAQSPSELLAPAPREKTRLVLPALILSRNCVSGNPGAVQVDLVPALVCLPASI
jgi:hypothetical protein